MNWIERHVIFLFLILISISPFIFVRWHAQGDAKKWGKKIESLTMQAKMRAYLTYWDAAAYIYIVLPHMNMYIIVLFCNGSSFSVRAAIAFDRDIISVKWDKIRYAIYSIEATKWNENKKKTNKTETIFLY